MTTNVIDRIDHTTGIELANTFPVSLREGFDFLSDVDHWPYWHSGMIKILGWRRQSLWSKLLRAPAGGAWDKPGDTVFFSQKYLADYLPGTVTLEEIRKYDLVQSVVAISGLPEVRQEYCYSTAGEGRFTLKVALQIEETTNLPGKAADATLFHSTTERHLRQTMVNLQDIFATGIPEPVFWV